LLARGHEHLSAGGLAAARHGVLMHILCGVVEDRYGALAAWLTSFGRGRLFTFDIGGGSTECDLLDGGESATLDVHAP
jgi:exopolyphosphatase/pppGpp-phosphohydrolase